MLYGACTIAWKGQTCVDTIAKRGRRVSYLWNFTVPPAGTEG